MSRIISFFFLKKRRHLAKVGTFLWFIQTQMYRFRFIGSTPRAKPLWRVYETRGSGSAGNPFQPSALGACLPTRDGDGAAWRRSWGKVGPAAEAVRRAPGVVTARERGAPGPADSRPRAIVLSGAAPRTQPFLYPGEEAWGLCAGQRTGAPGAVSLITVGGSPATVRPGRSPAPL